MATWDWGAYHGELLRRTQTIPPLMQSVWSEASNEARWLAPARFPLPIYRLMPTGNEAPERSLLSEHPCDPRDECGMTGIYLRQGAVEDIFRSSLIWSLVKQTPRERRRFLGMPMTDLEHPRIGYIHWHEVPPRINNKIVLGLSVLMSRSIARLSAGTVDHATNIGSTPIDYNALPQTEEEELTALPEVIIFDGTGGADRMPARLGYLFDVLRSKGIEKRTSRDLIVLLGSHRLNMGIIGGRVSESNARCTVYVDVPASGREYQTFFLGWERWRGTRGGPKILLDNADRAFKTALASIEALGMRHPARSIVLDPRGNRTAYNNQSTFDLTCTISAIQRDERTGRPVATVAQLCSGLWERATREQRNDLERFLWAFLKARGFDTRWRIASEEAVATNVIAVRSLPSALPYFFRPETDLAMKHAGEVAARSLHAKDLAIELAYQEIRENPLLITLFSTAFADGGSVLKLMNEPLALGFLAQCICRHLIAQTGGFTEDKLGVYPELMDTRAWATFTEQLFAAFDEANVPVLASQVLHAVYPYCLRYSYDTVPKILDGWKSWRERIIERIDGPIARPLERFKTAMSTVAKVTQEGYADAVVRASLRHNLATGNTVPPAWAHWVGQPLEDGGFGHLPHVTRKEAAERASYLRDLLQEPIPACDNAALLLDYAGKLA